MENHDNQPVSYFAYDGMKVSLERTNKRLWILCILLILLLVGTNGAWLYYESQFQVTETKTVTQDVDTGEGDAIVTGIGDVYGTSAANGQSDQNEDPQDGR